MAAVTYNTVETVKHGDSANTIDVDASMGSDDSQSSNSVSLETANSNDIAALREEMARIDSRMESISQRQIELLQERQDSKRKMTYKSKAKAVAISGSTRDVSRNFSPSRMKSKANVIAKVQQPYRNQQNNIDNEKRRLQEEKVALSKQRGEIETRIAELEGTQEELAAKRAAIKEKNKKIVAENKEKRKEFNRRKNAYSASARAAENAARNNMADMESNPEKWIDTFGVEGTVDLYKEAQETVNDIERRRRGKK